MFIFKITLPMNSEDGSSDIQTLAFGSSARVCISDTDRLLMFYLVLIVDYAKKNKNGGRVNTE
jgi:hypothetical protein